MIRVLLMANESVLADYIASALSEEVDLDVVRLTRRELGGGGRYSVVIVVDENESSEEAVALKDLLGEDVTLLLIKVSLKSRGIHIFESYQLINPGMEKLVSLVREFSRKNLKLGSTEEKGLLKKMNNTPAVQAGKQTRKLARFPVQPFAVPTRISTAEELLIRKVVCSASRKFLRSFVPSSWDKTQKPRQRDALISTGFET